MGKKFDTKAFLNAEKLSPQVVRVVVTPQQFSIF